MEIEIFCLVALFWSGTKLRWNAMGIELLEDFNHFVISSIRLLVATKQIRMYYMRALQLPFA
jgi:hypothetical protein